MLSFFRRIRKSLIESGSVRKYLLYAIGEIALVVVGILIALQINNWNQLRKEKAYENKMLAEINTSIKVDMGELSRMADLCQFLQEDAEEGLRILNATHVAEDSLADILGSNIQLGITFQTSAFESLKSRGLDYLSNDSIRIGLSKLYDQSYKKIEQSFNDYNQMLRGMWRPYLSEITRIVNKNGGLVHYPLNYNQIRNDAKVANQYETRLFLMRLLTSSLQRTIEECQGTSAVISRELGEKGQ